MSRCRTDKARNDVPPGWLLTGTPIARPRDHKRACRSNSATDKPVSRKLWNHDAGTDHPLLPLLWGSIILLVPPYKTTIIEQSP